MFNDHIRFIKDRWIKRRWDFIAIKHEGEWVYYRKAHPNELKGCL
jgi:hypothetical protein